MRASCRLSAAGEMATGTVLAEYEDEETPDDCGPGGTGRGVDASCAPGDPHAGLQPWPKPRRVGGKRV